MTDNEKREVEHMVDDASDCTVRALCQGIGPSSLVKRETLDDGSLDHRLTLN